MPTSKEKPHLNNLPGRLSTFVGREREIAEIKQRLSIHRLLTLTGPGGSGKTRLALQAAGELLAEFEDGVWLTEFAPLADTAFVPQALASVLGVSEQPGRALIPSLADRFLHLHSLLLFDNCEHLIGACAQLAEALLKACPDLSILATSRETLDIPGEAVFIVPSLSLPEPQPWSSPASAQQALLAYEQSEAVRLFIERATLASSSFELTAENGMWIAEICRRLDGMPLALELAAARVRALSVQQIAEHLDDSFHLLTNGSRTAPLRHQTLAATLDWSYALLSEAEQKVLQRLSVFADGCTLAAAEVVCSGNGVESAEILDVLSRLVDKSLILFDKAEDEVRYHLLETIRQYALNKLRESGKDDEVRDLHLDYFLQWAEKSKTHLIQPEQFVWLNRFEIEHDNIRAALQWSLVSTKGAGARLRLSTATSHFWKLRGFQTEGRTWLSTALAQTDTEQRTFSRAQALYEASTLAFYQSDYLASRTLAEESLAVSRELGADGQVVAADALEILAEVATETGNYAAAPQLYEQALVLYKKVGDLVGIGDTLKMLGWGAMRIGDYKQAESRLVEGLAACRESGDLHQVSSALSGLGELAVRRGQYERALDFLKESLDTTQHTGDKWGRAIALGSLGWIALLQRNYREMRKLLSESLDVRMETGDKGGIAWCLEKLAEASNLEGQPEKAVRTYGAAAALRAPLGSVIDLIDQPEYELILSGIRTKLGQQAFATAWAEGQAMALDLVVNYALSEPEISTVHSSPAGKEKFEGLTSREREVAMLVAQGKSNREIARIMTVSAKTSETYVTRILHKLGFNSRVQIATWAIEKGLYRKESK